VSLAERSALAMHASALAAGVVFVNGATLAALAEVRRCAVTAGLSTYATIDAGPHLKCLVRTADAEAAAAAARARAGVAPDHPRRAGRRRAGVRHRSGGLVRVFAPGKLVLTGAYAVLEGAPAIVVATSAGRLGRIPRGRA
jgi:hypothetical protein